MNHEDLLFYDIEVFQHDSLVVFKNYDNNEVAHFWSVEGDEDQPNGFEGVAKTISGKTLVGYNNHYYDDVVLSAMMAQRPQSSIKEINDALIGGEGVDSFGETKQSFANSSLDCMQQIDVSKPSLKKIEGNMGISIVESSIPFNIDRRLTDTEKEEVLEYCRHDVEATIDVFKLREKSYFQTKTELLSMIDNPKAARWNTTTISANILTDDPSKKIRWAKRESLPEEFLERFGTVEGIPPEVWEMWEKVDYEMLTSGPMPKGITTKLYDCDYTFGFGGLHGVHSSRGRFKNVKLLDVGSMYPSIIINLNALGNSTEKYDSIRKERLQIKHTDPTRSSALKLILNSVYGLLKNQYSTLYNPFAAYTVCIYGQMALFDLSRMLHEADYTLVNLNTDGAAFVDEKGIGNEEYESIWKYWENEWGLTLELDEFDLWIQKDVNNYVATHDGKIKVKGGEVNKYHDNKYFNNNDARIVQIALVEKLLNNTPTNKTVESHVDNPLLYQYVLKAGNTFKGVQDEEGNDYNNVNRVFAANERWPNPVKLQKVRLDGGKVNFPDAPSRMMVWNEDVNKFEIFKKYIDINHYSTIADKKLEGWPCI